MASLRYGLAQRKRTTTDGESIRQARFAEVVRSALCDIFIREDFSPTISARLSIIVCGVKMSADLRHARVFVRMRKNNHDATNRKTLTTLNSLNPQIRHALGLRVYARRVPTVRFEIDHSFDVGNKVESALKTIRLDKNERTPPCE